MSKLKKKRKGPKVELIYPPVVAPAAEMELLPPVVFASSAWVYCKNGHPFTDEFGHCGQKNCQYNADYVYPEKI